MREHYLRLSNLGAGQDMQELSASAAETFYSIFLQSPPSRQLLNRSSLTGLTVQWLAPDKGLLPLLSGESLQR